MSIIPMSQVWGLKIARNERLILLAMLDHADQDGANIYPGIPLLAWKTGYSENQVRNIIGKLVDRGLLKECNAQPGKPKVYCFQPDKAEYKPARGTQKVGRPKKNPSKNNTPIITEIPLQSQGETINTPPENPYNLGEIPLQSGRNTPTMVEGEKPRNQKIEPKDIEPKEKEHARAHTHVHPDARDAGGFSKIDIPVQANPVVTTLPEKPDESSQQPQTAISAETPPPVAAPPPPKPKRGKTTKGNPEDHAAIVALIDTWLKAQPHIIASPSHYSNHNKRQAALELHRAGVKPRDLDQYILETCSENPWWQTRAMSLPYIRDNIGAWKVDWDRHCNLPYYHVSPPLTPEQEAEVKKRFPPPMELEIPDDWIKPDGLEPMEYAKKSFQMLIDVYTKNQRKDSHVST